jgi:hypothetical protein
MGNFLTSARYAVFLLRKLGWKRFSIVLIYWFLHRYRRFVGPMFTHTFGRLRRGKIVQDPVLVYQMSKVGSTSLLYSLQYAYVKAGLVNVPVHHAHTLTNLDIHEQYVRQANGAAHRLALVDEYRQIRRDIEAKPDQRWTVISLVRDPVARQVSDYFHHIDRHLPDWRQRWRDGSLDIDQVVQSFLTIEDPTRHWFEGETLPITGIDVYATPFPYEDGYALYSRPPKMSLLVIRLEDMDCVACKAVQQMLGLKNFKLYPFNLGSETDYGEIYKQFKTKPLPASYLEKAYAGRMVCHFYTTAERERFAQKWSRAGK